MAVSTKSNQSLENQQSPAEGKLVKAEKRKRKRIVHDTESESEISEFIPEYMSSDDDSDYTEYDGPSSPRQTEFRHWYDSSPEDQRLLDANDGSAPEGASMEHRKDFDILFSIYDRQLTESEGFGIDDFPGPTEEAITPHWGSDLKVEYELMMEVAMWAIDEYNKKECNEFKYEVLKIEKVNGVLGAD